MVSNRSMVSCGTQLGSASISDYFGISNAPQVDGAPSVSPDRFFDRSLIWFWGFQRVPWVPWGFLKAPGAPYGFGFSLGLAEHRTTHSGAAQMVLGRVGRRETNYGGMGTSEMQCSTPHYSHLAVPSS